MRATRKSGWVLQLVMVLLFGAYALSVIQIILFKTIPVTAMFDMDNNLRSINIIPFHTISGFIHNGTTGGMRAAANILGNIVIFIPLGLLVSYQGSSKSFGAKAIILLSVPLALEIIQYVLALGSSDIDDIILNFAGGLMGSAIYKGISLVLHSRQRILGAIVVFYLISGISGIVAVGLVQPELLPFLDTGVEYVTEDKPELDGIDVYTKGDLRGSLAAVEEHYVELSTESETVMASDQENSGLPQYITENHRISIDAATRIFFEYVRVEKDGLLKFKIISRYEEKKPGELSAIMELPDGEAGSMHAARVWYADSQESTVKVLLVTLKE
ncbi:hypothetical protein P40081_32325 [Paenibacillus sp. FSL P4-0081]|uniref:VanZ family protein n=1 Tax=Paenibacillus sp. FSL P4-0081 TaxID=1536769 RepID=UPI0004F7C77E|nr:VanZ family protein [Paenibacillus sp. FSL P4-0081]AIQ32276.1 hypothetical protein P40081_32325 [Paenibacillus sp. FSL P4-0081]